MAPGASLVGLDVFGTFEDTTESNFLQAINYAVETDHVNVINESFGSQPVPRRDRAGLPRRSSTTPPSRPATVVSVSSGDAGDLQHDRLARDRSESDLGVGASTHFQLYAQTNYAAARYFATSGWLNDNISSLSSGGFNEAGGTVSAWSPRATSASLPATPSRASSMGA